MDKLSANLPQIIGAAAQSNLGILALLCIALSILAYLFFSTASQTVKVGIFVLLFGGVAFFTVAIYRTPETRQAREAVAATPAVVRYDSRHDEPLPALKSVGVDFSVEESAIKAWLDNDATLYPSISGALLDLLRDRQLKRPVYLDVVVYKYEHASNASASDTNGSIDPERLKRAVISSYNERHGANISNFDQLLR
jgi:hypothetical protein